MFQEDEAHVKPSMVGKWSLSQIPGISWEVCGVIINGVDIINSKNTTRPTSHGRSLPPPPTPPPTAPPRAACASLCRVGAQVMASWLPHLLMETFPCSEVAGTDFLGTGGPKWPGEGERLSSRLHWEKW